MNWQFFEGELEHDDVRRLLNQHFAEMRAGSPPEACHVLPIDGLRDDAIRFFTVREHGELLGCGALKAIASKHGEVKSMRTSTEALGRGVGKAMLDHIVATARSQGMKQLSLETGSTEQFVAANRLYEKNGFRRTAAFGDYADTDWTNFYTREI